MYVCMCVCVLIIIVGTCDYIYAYIYIGTQRYPTRGCLRVNILPGHFSALCMYLSIHIQSTGHFSRCQTLPLSSYCCTYWYSIAEFAQESPFFYVKTPVFQVIMIYIAACCIVGTTQRGYIHSSILFFGNKLK